MPVTQKLLDRYGADTVRTVVLSPPEQSFEWSEAGLDGAARFKAPLEYGA